MQRPRPQKLRTDVEPLSGPCDWLTPHDLHIVFELAAIDRDPDGGDRSDL